MSIRFAIWYVVTESHWLRERTQWVILQLEQMLDDMEMRTREWGKEFAEFEFRNYFEQFQMIRIQAFERHRKFKWFPLRYFPLESV